MRASSSGEADRGRSFPQYVATEVEDLRSRCAELESALRDYLIEAHVHSIDGLDECDHEVGVCFCAYHVALDRAVDTLGDARLKRLIRAHRYPPACDTISRS